MKIECIKEKLSSAISKAERVTGKNNTLPVLGCILLDVKNNTCTIKATNLDMGIKMTIPVKASKEGIVAVPGTVLHNFISNLYGDKNIKLELINGNLFVGTGKSSTTIKSLPYEDFPTIPEVSDGKSFTIRSLDLVKGLKSVWYSASTSSMKPELGSVYVYSDAEDLVFVATDSFRLAEKRVRMKKPKEIGQILIPFKNIPEIMRVLEEMDGDVEVTANKNQISFSAEGVYLTSRVIDGTFPDYKQIIPKKSTTEAVVLKEDFMNALKLANVFSDTFKQVNIKTDIVKKLLQIKTKNADIGENVNTLDAVLSGEGLEINFNYKYIMDCFQSIAADSVTLQFTALNRPMIIQGISDKSFTYLVMPMNK